MRTILLVILFLFNFQLIPHTRAQQWEWVKPGIVYANLSAGSIDNSRQTVAGIKVDGLGNTVVAGVFESGYISFGNTSLKSNFTETPFIVKYNKAGSAIWAKKIGGFGSMMLAGLTQDNEGNSYVAGHYNGSIIFSPAISLPADELNGPGQSFLAKYDQHGNVLWAKNIGVGDIYPQAITYSNTEIVVTGKFQDTIGFGSQIFSAQGLEDIFLSKFDDNGNPKWLQAFSGLGSDRGEDIKTDSKGNILLAGVFDFKLKLGDFTLSSNLRVGHFVAKFTSAGQLQWAKGFNSSNYNNALSVDRKGNVFLAGSSSIAFKADTFEVPNKGPAYSTSDVFISKIDPEGKVVWIKAFGSPANELGVALTTDNNGDTFVTGFFNKEFEIEGKIFKNDPLLQYDYKFDLFLFKIDQDGKVKWSNSAQLNLYQASFEYVKGLAIASDNAGALSLCGAYSKGVFNGEELPKANCNVFTTRLIDTAYIPPAAFIRGNIYEDINGNKIKDSAEPGIPEVILKAEPGPYYTLSDRNGNFFIDVEPGPYLVSQVLPESKGTIIKQVYPEGNQPLSIIGSESPPQPLNFANQILKCALLTIDIAADRRRRCFRSKTTVTYTNDGTADAQNVRIKVLYPGYVVPIKSSLAWTSRQDSALVFDIGTLKAGERRSFVITDSTICGNEAIRGLSQCVKAMISPKYSCISPSQSWDQSSVAVLAQLTDEGQTASFSIANEGTGDMTDSTAYRLYANEALVKQGKVMLAEGEKVMLAVPKPSATLRLEADQSANHPGMSRPTVSMQPPVVLPSMAAPTPADAAYQDDADAEISISCLNIIDSFDPNDKQVSPQGITRRHYIKAEDELQYQIRFQNTGTDTAYTVVVKDTLSAFVDVASLRIGSASHPFTYTVSGKGRPVLTFTFRHINLPDHKRNEPASHGYIKFGIRQLPDNPKGTVIRNQAYNYFDYNSPIATNEVYNIICDTLIAPVVPVVVYDCGQDLPTPALAGPQIHLCEASETVLQANVAQQGLGRWRIISGQATLSDPLNPQATLSGIGYGEVVLEWTISLCERVSRSQVKVYRCGIPAAPAIPAPSLQCAGSTLLPLVAAGSDITWYADARKQQKLHTGNSFIPQVHVTTTFYASQRVNGCESPLAAVEVKIHPATVSVERVGDTLVAPAADSYQWYFHDQELKGATGQRLFVKNTGVYRLRTTVNGCIAMSAPLDQVKHLPYAILTLGPNPASSQVYLELAAKETGEVRIFIWDRLGRKIGSFTSQKKWTVLEQSIDLHKLKPGLYLLEAHLGKEVLTRKFVKQ